jgi:hypothetical protein
MSPMKRAACRVALAACWLCAVVSSSARVAIAHPPQAATITAASGWVGQEKRIEEYLRTADVTRIEEIGTGVTRPRRAYLTPGGPFGSLTWKVVPPGRRGGHWESYKSEIAAYELDKLLGLGMVPPAVEREIKGDTGAAIMWVDGVRSVKQMGGKVPTGPAWGQPLRKMLMFDALIANDDRNAGNILVGQPGELILIDHSRAFITDLDLQKFERVDAELWDKMKALTLEDLRRVLQPWIDPPAINAIVERRNRMVAAVDKLVAKKGKALVIIP